MLSRAYVSGEKVYHLRLLHNRPIPRPHSYTFSLQRPMVRMHLLIHTISVAVLSLVMQAGYAHPSPTCIFKTVVRQQTRAPVAHLKTRFEREGVVGGGAPKTLVNTSRSERMCLMCIAASCVSCWSVWTNSRGKTEMVLIELSLENGTFHHL